LQLPFVENDENKIFSGTIDICVYPNPFNPDTRISYRFPEEAKVELSVYNLKGQLVKRLTEEVQCAGEYVADWDGRNGQDGRSVSSGIYLVRLKVGEQVMLKRIMLIK
jgi:hypothetical protein